MSSACCRFAAAMRASACALSRTLRALNVLLFCCVCICGCTEPCDLESGLHGCQRAATPTGPRKAFRVSDLVLPGRPVCVPGLDTPGAVPLRVVLVYACRGGDGSPSVGEDTDESEDPAREPGRWDLAAAIWERIACSSARSSAISLRATQPPLWRRWLRPAPKDRPSALRLERQRWPSVWPPAVLVWSYGWLAGRLAGWPAGRPCGRRLMAPCKQRADTLATRSSRGIRIPTVPTSSY